MTKFFIVILLTLSAVFSANAQGMRAFNEVSIVALIITSGEETPVSASVTHTLESLDAQVLTAIAPNASQMRSILKRFASAAIDVDVALVYYDGAVLKIGNREFVAPGGITLRRRSDLLTKAIPLSALARATALAGNGGAVLVHSTGRGVDLIEGITLVSSAPDARTGTSPILFASSSAAMGLADGLEKMAEATGNINLSDALRSLSELDGVSISQQPIGATMLRVLPAPEVAPTAAPPVVDPATAATETADTSGESSLPQVGNNAPEADSAADVAAAVEANQQADSMAEPMADNATTDMVNTDATDDTTQAAEAALAADSELSIDVLRAMQGALSRGKKRMLQLHLRNMGYYRGLIDGIFGPQTARAISAYQESLGAAVTGVLTPIQLEALSE